MGNASSFAVIDDETFGEEGHFKVHIKLYAGLDREHKIKLREACNAWVAAWQSVEFKEWLLAYVFKDTYLTSEEIYSELVGKFECAGIVEKGADIQIWAKPGATGAALTSVFVHDDEQWKGTDYLGVYTPAKLAGHLAHEYCRSLNFLHTSAAAQMSVPFAVGKKTKQLAEAAAFNLAESTSVKYFSP